MKFLRVAKVAGFSAWMLMGMAVAGAADGESSRGAAAAAGKPLGELIEDLANDQFRIREAATRAIWRLGDSALDALQGAATGKDAEQSYRARELIRKIQLHITPDTDPAVILLVERYEK